jgi:3',5'-cyclic AMP phosphodiesterase CpdA
LLGAVVFCGCQPDFDSQAPPFPDEQLWMRFVHFSDTQIVDEESPARAVHGDEVVDASWRPEEEFTTQTLDATVKVINQLHLQKPIDFVIQTGDATDSSQWNELRWFIDVMDGKTIDPDSGAHEGSTLPLTPNLNPHLSFQAAGLHPDIPWYSVFGNHDGLAVGTFGITTAFSADPRDWYAPLDDITAWFLGLDQVGLDALTPTAAVSAAIIKPGLDIMDTNTLKLKMGSLRAGAITPDDRRHFTDRRIYVEEHFNSPAKPGPVGHGFSAMNIFEESVRYTFRPKANAPVRWIVLDSVMDHPAPREVSYQGYIGRDQFELFLKPAVAEARRRGEYIIIATHHPSQDFQAVASGVSTSEFRNYLASQPNILAHFCGHKHANAVEMIAGKYPYLEVQTGSIIDYPQEARLLELYYSPSTKGLRLASRMIRHSLSPVPAAMESLRRATVDCGADPMPNYSVAKILEPKVDKLLKTCNSPGQAKDRDFSVAVVRPL